VKDPMKPEVKNWRWKSIQTH